MKKNMMFLLLLIAFCLLSACDSDNPNPIQQLETTANENDKVVDSVENTIEVTEETPTQTELNAENKIITLTIGDVSVTAELDNSEVARQFAALLPQTITMSRGRDREYYGRIDGTLTYDENDIQTTAEDGDLAYWFSGNSLAFFFNTENDSAVNSGIVVFGKITSDLSVFNNMSSSETVTVALSA